MHCLISSVYGFDYSIHKVKLNGSLIIGENTLS